MSDEILSQEAHYYEQLAEEYAVEKEEFYQAFLRRNPSFVEMFLKLTDDNNALLESTVKEVYTFSQE